MDEPRTRGSSREGNQDGGSGFGSGAAAVVRARWALGLALGVWICAWSTRGDSIGLDALGRFAIPGGSASGSGASAGGGAGSGGGYPDISSGIGGGLRYRWLGDDVALLEVTNVPYLLTLGPEGGEQYPIRPMENGARELSLRVLLDRWGHPLATGSGAGVGEIGGLGAVDFEGGGSGAGAGVSIENGNEFVLRGMIERDGRSLAGELLRGVVTNVQFQPRVGASGSGSGPGSGSASGMAMDVDVRVSVTGGELAGRFGKEASWRFAAALPVGAGGPGIEGWGRGYDFGRVEGNLVAGGEAPPRDDGMSAPSPIPEPSTLLILISGMTGLLLARGKVGRPGRVRGGRAVRFRGGAGTRRGSGTGSGSKGSSRAWRPGPGSESSGRARV